MPTTGYRDRLRDLAERASEAGSRAAALRARLHDRVSGHVAHDLGILKDRLGSSSDLVYRRFLAWDGARWLPAAVVYVDGLANAAQVETQILWRLMKPERDPAAGLAPAREPGDWVRRMGITASQVKARTRFKSLVAPVFSGDVILLVEGSRRAYLIGMRNPPERAISEPETEAVIRGPRDGFTETLRTNTALIRRRLRTGTLVIRSLSVGQRTRTAVAVCYVADIASPDLVREVVRRIRVIRVDGVLGSGAIEQFIQDNHYSPFPQVVNTERPDKVVANLLEGRVAILVDGTPFALIVPAVFNQFYQTIDDYNERLHIASFIRAIRLLSLFISLVVSSLYVSLISFNPEMIPTKFAAAVAGGRSGIPFPAVIEVLILEVVMEILREASLHLPKTIGNTISIVGVLVIGQAAVSSGFVSPISVVIVASAAIGSFATPNFSAAIALRLLRFILIILSGIFGLYGVLVGLIVIVNHMLSLESFGQPYMAPLAPLRMRGMLDALALRAPLWTRVKRPPGLDVQDVRRERGGMAGVLDEKRNVLDPARPNREPPR